MQPDRCSYPIGQEHTPPCVEQSSTIGTVSCCVNGKSGSPATVNAKQGSHHRLLLRRRAPADVAARAPCRRLLFVTARVAVNSPTDPDLCDYYGRDHQRHVGVARRTCLRRFEPQQLCNDLPPLTSGGAPVIRGPTGCSVDTGVRVGRSPPRDGIFTRVPKLPPIGDPATTRAAAFPVVRDKAHVTRSTRALCGPSGSTRVARR